VGVGTRSVHQGPRRRRRGGGGAVLCAGWGVAIMVACAVRRDAHDAQARRHATPCPCVASCQRHVLVHC
jgi:hypothetical protein